MKLRKVRNGCVKINGRWYKPNVRLGDPTPKHFEGQRFAFGLYGGPLPGRRWFVSLWGTEAMFRAKADEDFEKAYSESLKVLTTTACIDVWDEKKSPNVFLWTWWDEARCHILPRHRDQI